MEEFSIENVLRAVHSMYSAAPQPNYKEIDNWLKNYQKSSAAWGLTSSIFSNGGLPEYVYIFNAQTLKTKLMYDFEELKGIDLVPFKNNLLNLCLQFSEQEKVMRQLAQCIGILGIHLVDIWGEAMLSEISRVFADKVLFLLEVLKSIAEEINNELIVVDSDKVKKLRLILETQTSEIIRFLESCSNDYSLIIIDVFLVWVQLGNENVAAILPQSRLLILSFDAIKIPQKFETACGVLCEIINLTEDYEKFKETILILISFLINLKADARKVISDDALIEGYIKIYTTFGNTHIKRLLTDNLTEILDFLADLFATESGEGIYMLSQFWHRFCRVYRVKKSEEPQDGTELFVYLMQKLLPMCLKHYQLQPEELEKGIEKETEENRYNVSIIIQDIVQLLTQQAVLSLFRAHLDQILSITTSLTFYEKYSQLEAIAGCMIGIVEESAVSEELLSIFIQLSREIWPVLQVNTTICRVFAINTCPLTGESLTKIINYLVNCLKAQVPSKEVASAVKNICIVNSIELLNHLPSLLQLHNISLALSEEAQELMLEGISSVIWRAPIESRAIIDLCSVFTKNLRNDMKIEELLFNCDKIAVIIKNGFDKDIPLMNVYHLFKEIWPELKRLVEAYQSNDNAVEDICRIVKHAMKKLQVAFGEFLEDFAHIISNQFFKYRHSSYLYMAEQLVKIFGSSNQYEEMLMNLFNILTSVTLSELNTFESLQEKPELTEDFFGMVTRYLNYCPKVTLKSQNFENILVLGKLGIGLQQIEAAKCLYGFLETSFDFCNKDNPRYFEYSAEKLLGHFKDILIALVSVIVNVVSGRIFDFVEELCFKILIIDQGADWLGLALTQVPHDCLTEAEKLKFIQECKSASNIHGWLDWLHKRSKRRAMRLR